MDQHRLPSLTRSLTRAPSRRDVVRGLASAGLALGVARISSIADAKKQRKRKRPKKAKPNAFGCRSVGVACQNAEQCCSGICQGKKCRAHGTGTCRQDKPGYCASVPDDYPYVACQANCGCFRTTAGSNFCSRGVATGGEQCTDCKKDADCIALGYPAGSACAPTQGINCGGFCDSGMACLYPCGLEPE